MPTTISTTSEISTSLHWTMAASWWSSKTRTVRQINQAIIASEWSTTPEGTASHTASHTIAISPDAGDIVRTPTVTAAADGSYTVGYEDYDSSEGNYRLNFVNVSAGGAVSSEDTAVSGRMHLR